MHTYFITQYPKFHSGVKQLCHAPCPEHTRRDTHSLSWVLRWQLVTVWASVSFFFFFSPATSKISSLAANLLFFIFLYFFFPPWLPVHSFALSQLLCYRYRVHTVSLLWQPLCTVWRLNSSQWGDLSALCVFTCTCHGCNIHMVMNLWRGVKEGKVVRWPWAQWVQLFLHIQKEYNKACSITFLLKFTYWTFRFSSANSSLIIKFLKPANVCYTSISKTSQRKKRVLQNPL